MTWRTVILSNDSKISLRMNHLIVSGVEVVRIPINEIGTVIIENPNIVMTGHLLNALSEQKITIVICDRYHNPKSNISPIYGNFRQARNIKQQIAWKTEKQELLWQIIIKHKILNQKQVLHHFYEEDFVNFDNYIAEVELDDVTNREGHAAKVYFNKLFGRRFIRRNEDSINWALNYGYSLLLSLFNRVIVGKGLLTEIGVHHKNQFNQFNLSSDLMEVYRPIVDVIVKNNVSDEFGKFEKRQLVEMFNEKVIMKNGRQFIPNSVEIYIDSIIRFLQNTDDNIIEVDLPNIKSLLSEYT